jgi:cellulose synthase/poly-beta-1,6-N-acetylglucosamine synthase-like glycosyltransferase
MTGQLALCIVTIALSASALLGSAYILFLAWVGARTGPPRSDLDLASRTAQTRFLVLVPAHNEETGIRPTLASLSGLAYPLELFTVAVIADNCIDHTADVVRKVGHQCWVRTDVQFRGKGQALRWAIDCASGLDFDAIVILDADSQAHPDLLLTFDKAIANGAQAAQVRYDFRTKGGSEVSTSTVIGKNAENSLFWRPRNRLGLSVFLQGNGFCLSRDVLRHIPWSAYSVVEDIEYSMQLAARHIRVVYLESASVVAQTATCSATAMPQRLRWASGTFQIVCRYVPRLLIEAVRQRSMYLVETAFALLLISRMLLVYLTVASFGLSFLVPQVSFAIRSTVVFSLVLQFLYLQLAFRAGANHRPSRISMICFPLYLGWLCIAQGLALLGLRRNVWARTERS